MCKKVDYHFIAVLRWTYRGQAVNSSLSLELAEGSGSQVVMTVERLVAAEVTTTLTLRRVVGTCK